MWNRSRLKQKLAMVPKDRKGPNGISDLIVKLLPSKGKLLLCKNRFKKRAERAKAAPIQKAKITAESPWTSPRKNPMTNMYLTSPKPSHPPREMRKTKSNGKATATPESK